MRQRTKSANGNDWHRQRRFNAIVLSVALVATVVTVAYALTYTGPLPPVSLPPYLNQCIPLTGKPLYVSTPTIQIYINGESHPVPANIGVSGSCIRPINTRGPAGVIHVDAFENRTYTVGDFFLVWGATYGPTFAIFNKNQIFNFKTDANHNITMSVNDFPDPLYQDTPFPTNANVTSRPFSILISYG